MSPFRLYNLARDLGESHDLAEEESEKAEELQKAWKAWDAQLASPLWGESRARAGARRKRSEPVPSARDKATIDAEVPP